MIKQTKKSVTFIYEGDADEVILKGSWNDWQEEPMKRNKKGEFTKTKRLKPGTYQFGYLVDGRWEVDQTLPTTPSPFGTMNNILKVGS